MNATPPFQPFAVKATWLDGEGRILTCAATIAALHIDAACDQLSDYVEGLGCEVYSLFVEAEGVVR